MRRLGLGFDFGFDGSSLLQLDRALPPEVGVQQRTLAFFERFCRALLPGFLRFADLKKNLSSSFLDFRRIRNTERAPRKKS